VLQHRRTGCLEIVAVSDRALLRLADEASQFGLALDQGHAGQVAAIEMEQIEDVVEKAVTLAGFQRGL
jgi:hypothetical protein